MQVIYIAPEGDADSVIMGGFTFRDGEQVEIPADARIAAKLATNQHFIVQQDGEASDEPACDEDAPKRRGRPPKAASKN